MARAGILYSQVARAAAKLVADGKNPTVDSVREGLGGTGSKSTIAPLLKRWKAQHQETVAASETGVPADLLQAVKDVYNRLQTDVQQQLHLAHEEHQRALQHVGNQVAEGEAANSLLASTNATLSKELEQTKEALAQLQAAHQTQTVVLATRRAEGTGLQQRLTDRQGEIVGLHRQLDQARTQFEHYQEATALQRAEERQEAEQSRLRLENELTEARQSLAVRKAALTQRELDITRLQQEKNRAATELTSLHAAYTTLHAEHGHQQQQIGASSLLHAELRAQLEAATSTLAQIRSELAILSAEKPQFQSRIAYLEAEVQSLLDENKTLIIDKARLEGMQSRSAMQPGGV